MRTEPDPASRVGALDGLRGLAIVALLAFQTDVLFGGVFGLSHEKLVSRLIGAGWLGIDLFFVLTGFFITTILLEQKETNGFWRFLSRFYARRAFRIVPLYYSFLFLYLYFLRFYPVMDTGYPIFPHNEWSFMLFYYNNAAALHDYAIPNLHIYWALCIEVQFFLAWPLFVWILSSSRALQWVCGGLALLALVLRLIVVQWPHGMPIAAFATPCRLDGLALGSLVALLRRDGVQWEKVSRWGGALTATLALAILGIGWSQGHYFAGIDFRYIRPPIAHDSRIIQTWGLTAVVWFCTALLVFVLAGRSRISLGVSRVLGCAPLRSLGLFSFAMYLFHGVIFHALDFYAAKVLPHYGDYDPGVAKPIAALILVAVSYGVACVIYFVWDRPFMNMIKRWTG